jgi:hypothetical protein
MSAVVLLGLGRSRQTIILPSFDAEILWDAARGANGRPALEGNQPKSALELFPQFLKKHRKPAVPLIPVVAAMSGVEFVLEVTLG